MNGAGDALIALECCVPLADGTLQVHAERFAHRENCVAGIPHQKYHRTLGKLLENFADVGVVTWRLLTTPNLSMLLSVKLQHRNENAFKRGRGQRIEKLIRRRSVEVPLEPNDLKDIGYKPPQVCGSAQVAVAMKLRPKERIVVALGVDGDS